MPVRYFRLRPIGPGAKGTARDVIDFRLTPEEAAQFKELGKQTQQLTLDIGLAEVRKHRLMAALAEREERGAALVEAVNLRLGLPEGTAWQARPDGTLVVVDPATGLPVNT